MTLNILLPATGLHALSNTSDRCLCHPRPCRWIWSRHFVRHRRSRRSRLFRSWHHRRFWPNSRESTQFKRISFVRRYRWCEHKSDFCALDQHFVDYHFCPNRPIFRRWRFNPTLCSCSHCRRSFRHILFDFYRFDFARNSRKVAKEKGEEVKY